MTDLRIFADILFVVICVLVVLNGDAKNKGKWLLLAIGVSLSVVTLEHIAIYLLENDKA